MKHAVSLFVALLWATLPSTLVGRDAADLPSEAGTEASPLLEALKMREHLAREILGGGVGIESALEQLRLHPAPTGLGLGREAEYAFAALEIGLRLIAAQRPETAAAFFLDAEKALGAALEGLDEKETHEKVLVLRQRAFVRSRYLGKGAEAKTDFEEAIRLRPEDKAIVRQRDSLLSGYGELNRATVPNEN